MAHSRPDAVHHYEGTVNQVMGDGIMALLPGTIRLTGETVRVAEGYVEVRSLRPG